LAEEFLGISYVDLTIDDMAVINEVLTQCAHLRGKELLRAACIEHVRCLQDLNLDAVRAIQDHCMAG
jgi:hypothetical protein